MMPLSWPGGPGPDEARGGMSAFRLSGLGLWLAACAGHPYEARPLALEPAAEAFAARRLTDPVLLARVGLADAAPECWNRVTLTRIALALRPELALARTVVTEAEAGALGAATRPNPTLLLGPELVPGATHPWILAWMLDWPLELGGTRARRRELAQTELSIAELEAPLAAWKVRAEVEAACDEWSGAEAELVLAERRRSLAERRLDVQRARLAAGAAGRLEADLAERASLEDELALEESRARRSRALSGLATALSLPRAALEETRLALESALLPTPPGELDARELALTNRLDLAVALAEYERSEAELRLEIARQYPDFRLSPGLSYDQGDRKIGLGVALELPLFDRSQGPIAVAEARRASAGTRVLALEERLLGALESARVDYVGALERLARGERLFAQAERARVNGEGALAAGGLERLALLELELSASAAARIRASARDEALRARRRFENELHRPLEPEPTPAP